MSTSAAPISPASARAASLSASSAPASSAPATSGVLLCNLGGPATVADVGPFLRRLFSDREIMRLPWQSLSARLIARLRRRKVEECYREIGGGSPILELTEAQAEALRAALAARGCAVRTYVAMRYSPPFADQALARAAADGVRRLVVLPLYPQYSMATSGSSLADLRRAIAYNGHSFELEVIDRFHHHPGYLDALADSVRATLAGLPEAERAAAKVIFSAHGLPQSLVARGDPYEGEVRATVDQVRRRLGEGREYVLSFQSKVGPVRWLEPHTDQLLLRMARAGTKVVVVVAVSFVSDHLETLHEIDIRYRRQVAGLGMRLVRAPALGTSTAFIDALADLCQDRLAKDRQRDGRAGQSRPLDGRGADGRPAESPPGMAPPDGKQGSRA